MLRYNLKLRLLISISIILICASVFIVWIWHYEPINLPNDGRLKLVDGENIIINNDGYELNLDTFTKVGETQRIVFVFENQNSAPSNTYVTTTYDNKYFEFDYDETFTINSKERFEYVVYITLIDYPNDSDSLPLSINFNTSYM